MFTIKHIAPNGDEFAVEAASYSVELIAPNSTSDEIRVVAHDEPYKNGNSIGLWNGKRENFPLGNHAIYVMNSKGATVASHYFSTPPSGTVG